MMTDQQAATWLERIKHVSGQARSARGNLHQLDLDTRTLMLEAHAAGCTVVEIADAAGISRQVATKRLYRARGGPQRPRRVRA